MPIPSDFAAAAVALFANLNAFIGAMDEPSALVMGTVGVGGLLLGRYWSSYEARKARD